MGNSKFRAIAIAILVSLIIGGAAGYLIGHRAGVKEASAATLLGAKVVYIGPDVKKVNPPELPISFRNKDVVYWKPWPPSVHYAVGVVFKKGQFPQTAQGEPPFVGGQPNTDQTIQCGGGSCFSYDINPNLGPILQNLPTRSLTYDYWQSLDNGGLADARIIINW